MKRGVLPALAWLALVCASWGVMGCSGGGDDDVAVDDDLAATDDDAGADDVVSDDALAADDDAADDDDDNDADLQWLIIGKRDDQTMSSWRYCDGAWEEQPIPLPLGANQYYLGPSAVIDGTAGHVVWNICRDGVWLSREHTQTTSDRWLTYEPNKGWQRDLTMAQPGSATKAMSDSNHAYGIWQEATGSVRELLELTEGAWSKVAASAGCGDVWPTRVWMVGDRIIAAPIGDYWEVRFWEHRDGDWTCRRLAEGTRHAAQQDFAIRTTDGRVFATGTWSDIDGPFLLEITATDVVDIPLPANLSTAERVYVLGAAAPAQSNFAISNQIPGS